MKRFLFFLCFFLPAFITPVKAVTEAELVSKLNTVLTRQEQVYPLYTQTGRDVDNDGILDTLTSLDLKYAAQTPEIQAEWRARLFVAVNKPTSTTDIAAWYTYRQSMKAAHTILARHHLHRWLENGQQAVDRDRAIVHTMMSVVHVDAMTTGPEHSPVFPINVSPDPPVSYRLRDNRHVARFLPDGSGIFAIWGWMYDLDLLPRYYCTTLETPYDAGRNCKTINLWERIRRVSSSVTTKIASEWMIKNDGSLRSEYWDSNVYWNTYRSGFDAYETEVNTNFNPATGNGWFDLLGRRTMVKDATWRELMDPHFFQWQMGGMADTAKMVLNEGGVYSQAYNFGIDAAGWLMSVEPGNPAGDFTKTNYLGKPVRGLQADCNGTITLPASDPLAICQGGTKEFFQYRSDLPIYDTPSSVNLSYAGQHFGVIMETVKGNPLPQVLQDNAMAFYWAYKATFSKDGDSYLDTTNGGYNRNTILKYFPDGLGTCQNLYYPGTTDFKPFIETPSGRIMAYTGETPAELLSTIAPTFFRIISFQDPTRANEVMVDADALLTDLVTDPLRPEDLCSSAFFSSTSTYAKVAWQRNNLLAGYFRAKYLSVPTFAKACDRDANLTIAKNDVRLSLLSYGTSSNECTDDRKNNALDGALTISSIEPPPTPTPTAVSGLTTIGSYAMTEGDVATQNRRKIVITSADGQTVYDLFYSNGAWDVNWRPIAVSSLGAGVIQIRSFDQSISPANATQANTPRQTILSADGTRYWSRWWESATSNWGTWLCISVKSNPVVCGSGGTGLPGDPDKIADYSMTHSDPQGAHRKLFLLSANGETIYLNTHNGSVWSGWQPVTVSTYLNISGINKIRSFNQSRAPNGNHRQTAVSADGRTHWIRWWNIDIANNWGAWTSNPNTSLNINGQDTSLLPVPIP